MVLLLFCNSLIFKFRFLLSLLQYLIERFLQKKAPERGVAAEEFCVFGDWGVNPNKSEKPERSGRCAAETDDPQDVKRIVPSAGRKSLLRKHANDLKNTGIRKRSTVTIVKEKVIAPQQFFLQN